jgi:hypothetical protein
MRRPPESPRPTAPLLARPEDAPTHEKRYEAATVPPRSVRTLAEQLLAWSLSKSALDARGASSDPGDQHAPLLDRFGFRIAHPGGETHDESVFRLTTTRDQQLVIAKADALFRNAAGVVVAVSVSDFRPRIVTVDQARDTAETWRSEPMVFTRTARAPSNASAWMIAWHSVAEIFRQLSRFEAWVVDEQGIAYRRRTALSRPRAARRAAVKVEVLPHALSTVAEWCVGCEQALLAWIAADARLRGDRVTNATRAALSWYLPMRWIRAWRRS